MAKVEYTALFEQFWQAYPRKTAKPNAFKAWQKLRADEDAFLPKAIIGDVEKRTRLRFWPLDASKIPHPATWLNQRRWEDEGWEDEIRSRGKDGVAQPSARAIPMPRTVDDGPMLSGWHMMLNRLARNYIWLSGGLSDAQIKAALNIKHEVLREMEPLADDEARKDPTTRGEMAVTMAEAMLHRFDHDLGLNLRARVLAESRKAAQAAGGRR